MLHVGRHHTVLDNDEMTWNESGMEDEDEFLGCMCSPKFKQSENNDQKHINTLRLFIILEYSFFFNSHVHL